MLRQEIENVYDFFENLTSNEKEMFFTHAKEVAFPKGQILFWQGDTCGGILYLQSGSVKVYLQNDEGDEITLYTLNAGEQCVVNTSSAISLTPALGSAVTLSDVKGYMLDSSAVKALMKASPAYQEYMFTLFSLKLTSLASLVEDIKFKPLKERIINTLKQKKTREIILTHEALAQNLGTSRVVVSRVLKELEKEGRVTLKRGAILLHL